MIEGALTPFTQCVLRLTSATPKLNRVSTLHNYGCFQEQTRVISTDITKCCDTAFHETKRQHRKKDCTFNSIIQTDYMSVAEKELSAAECYFFPQSQRISVLSLI